MSVDEAATGKDYSANTTLVNNEIISADFHKGLRASEAPDVDIGREGGVNMFFSSNAFGIKTKYVFLPMPINFDQFSEEGKASTSPPPTPTDTAGSTGSQQQSAVAATKAPPTVQQELDYANPGSKDVLKKLLAGLNQADTSQELKPDFSMGSLRHALQSKLREGWNLEATANKMFVKFMKLIGRAFQNFADD